MVGSPRAAIVVTLAVVVLLLSTVGVGLGAPPARAPSPLTIVPETTTALQDWPTYLGNVLRTSNNTSETWLTPSNAQALGVNWSFQTGGSVVSSTTVVNGTAYFGSWDGYEYAVNATTGHPLWKTFLGQDSFDPACYSGNPIGVSSAPTEAGGVLYLGGENATGGEIASWYALNASTGAIEWSVPVGNMSNGYYNWASPLIYRGFAYVGIASSCDEPLVPAGLLQVNLTSHRIQNFFRTTPFNTGTDEYDVGASIWGSPSVDPKTGTVFAATGNPAGPPGGVVALAEPYSEAVLAFNWSNISRNAAGLPGLEAYWPLPESEQVGDGDFGIGPTVLQGAGAGGGDLLIAPDKNGYVYALNGTNLASWTVNSTNLGTLWQIDTHTTVSSLLPPAAYGDGLVFFGTPKLNVSGVPEPGSIWAVKPTTGAVVWNATLGGSVTGAPLYANGVLVVGAAKHLYAFNAATGAQLGSWLYSGSFVEAPAIAEGRLFVGNENDIEYALCVRSSSCSITYAVTFTESGLPAGDRWYVNITHGPSLSAVGSTTTLQTNLPNGTYSFTVATNNKTYAPSSYTPTFVVSGAAVPESVSFEQVASPTFSESGLPPGLTWSVTFNGLPMSLTTNGLTDTLAFSSEPNGTYGYSIADISGWHQSSVAYSGTETLTGTALLVSMTYSQVTYTAAITETGLPSGRTFQLTVGGVTNSLTTDGGADTLTVAGLVNGTTAYSLADVSGWHQSTIPYAGSVVVNGGTGPIGGTGLGYSFGTVSYGQVTYAVTFSESGLPGATSWSVTLNGQPLASTASTVAFAEPNGTYAYSIAGIAGWTQGTLPYSGSVTVSGAAIAEPTLVFTQVTYAVTIRETGLLSGTSWSVTINSDQYSSTSGTITLAEPNGTYSYTVMIAAGGNTAGSFTVNGAPATVTAAFYKLTFSETGLPTAAVWQITTNGDTMSSTTSSIVYYLVNGTYAYAVGLVPGYHTTESGKHSVSGKATTVTVKFSPTTYTVEFTETGLDKAWKTTWCVTFNGVNQCSTSASISFTSILNGTYGYVIGYLTNYTLGEPYSGSVTVAGGAQGTTSNAISVPWTLVVYSVTFSETGLKSKTSWSVTLNHKKESSKGTTISFSISNGTYAYTVSASGYVPAPPNGGLTVAGAAVAETVTFTT